MFTLSVSSKHSNGALNGFGKGLLVSLIVSASALTHAGPLAGQSIYVDTNCGVGGDARHGNSRGGCSVSIDEQRNALHGPAASVQPAFGPSTDGGETSFAVSVGPLVGVASIASVAATVVAPPEAVLVKSEAVSQVAAAAAVVVQEAIAAPQQIVAEPAPANLSVADIAVASVPEPSTLALLLAGFLALIGIRRIRATSKT